MTNRRDEEEQVLDQAIAVQARLLATVALLERFTAELNAETERQQREIEDPRV